jgi:hypothetical protein
VSACSAPVLIIPVNFDWVFGSFNMSETKGLLYQESFGNVLYTWVISKVLHTALAWPVGWSNRSDFRDSCEPDFCKEHWVPIGRLRGPCSAKRSLEMEEETDWSQITIKHGLIPQVQYRKFWKSMDGKCFLTRRTVLTWAHQTLNCSQNWRNPSVGNTSEALRRHLMQWPE